MRNEKRGGKEKYFHMSFSGTQWRVQPNRADGHYYFVWNVEAGRIPATVCIERDVVRVNIICNGSFDESDKTAYKLTLDKHLFWSNLKMHTFPMGVIVNVLPNVEELENVQFIKMIYFDALTQDNLINTIIRVIDALEIGGFAFRRFIESLESEDRTVNEIRNIYSWFENIFDFLGFRLYLLASSYDVNLMIPFFAKAAKPPCNSGSCLN
jgi:hypothetical protein